MAEFKRIKCINNDSKLAKKGKTYWYDVSEDERLDLDKFESVKTGELVYHIYVADNHDAWLFNTNETKFMEQFREF